MIEPGTPQARSGNTVIARWGPSYRGVGEAEDVLAATVRTFEYLKLDCGVRRRSPEEVWIEGRSRLAWYRLLAGHHLQRVRGRIENLGPTGPDRRIPTAPSELRLSLDPSFLPWYRWLVLGLWVVSLLGLSSLLWLTEPDKLAGRGSSAEISLVAMLVCLGIVAWIPFLLRSLGGSRVQAELWQPILESVDEAGGYLEPERTGISRRYALWNLGYGFSFLVFGGGMLVETALEGAWSLSRRGFSFLALMTALAALLLLTAVPIALWRGLGLRVEAIILGIVSSMSVLFLLATPLLLTLTSRISTTALAAPPSQAGWWSREVLGGTLLIPAFGLALGAFAVGTSHHVWRPLQRTHSHRGHPGLYRDAARGGPLLTVARASFGAYAVLLIGTVVPGLVLAAIWGIHASMGSSSGSPLFDLPTLTGPLLASALGRPQADPLAHGVARAAWVVWAATVWGLFALSVGELVRKRHRLRRCLEEHRLKDVPAHRALRARADRLRGLFGGPEVHLAVSTGSAIKAFAHRFAWPCRRWFIEVSEGALQHLTADEFEALLAHELVHLRRGHVLCLDLACWIARVGFLGDGFCKGLLNSFSWEATADREAAQMLGDRREALVRCLWKAAAGSPNGAAGDLPVGLGIEPSLPRGETPGRKESPQPFWKRRWFEAWRQFIDQYVGRSQLHYWHPVTDERVARIRSFGGAP